MTAGGAARRTCVLRRKETALRGQAAVSARILAIASVRVSVRGKTCSTPVIEITRSTIGSVPS